MISIKLYSIVVSRVSLASGKKEQSFWDWIECPIIQNCNHSFQKMHIKEKIIKVVKIFKFQFSLILYTTVHISSPLFYMWMINLLNKTSRQPLKWDKHRVLCKFIGLIKFCTIDSDINFSFLKAFGLKFGFSTKIYPWSPAWLNFCAPR